jgi:IMP dehydrogenase/GMP reductase
VFEQSYGFDDIGIIQKKNICESRLDVDIKSEIIRGVYRPIGLIASNMSTVINPDFYKQIYALGAFSILHRAYPDYNSRIDEIIRIKKDCEWVATSVGIDNQELEIATLLIKAGANILTIDIANAYCDRAIELGRFLKKNYPHCKIVIGNTANIGLLEESADFADGVKLGIANGFACETKFMTGCNEKQFSTVLKFKERSKELGIPVISDGAITKPADYVKSIAAGANSAMAGAIFCRCPESSGETVEIAGKLKKVYAGMSSRFVQEHWRGMKKGICPEGTIKYLDIGEPVESLLLRYSGALKSAISYAGGSDIRSFQDNVEFVRYGNS